MNTDGQIAFDIPPFIRTYKDGRIERLLGTSSFVPASEDQAKSRGGVVSRDVVIDQETGVSARLFLPLRAAATRRRLPVVMYVHGGSFCTGSAFSRLYHRYATSLAACCGALVVSVEYRLAPEYPIPAAYDDAWAALRWASDLSDPWIAAYADPERTFLAGDSAGGNIVYHTAVRASREGGVLDILGLIMVHPFFWGPEWLPSEKALDGAAMFPPSRMDLLWPCVTAGQAGNDDLRINPPNEEIASLTCRRVLVAVAQKDTLVDRGRRLSALMSNSPWIGDNVTLVESQDEDHVFHLYSPLRVTSKELMESMVQFINHCPISSPPPTQHKHCPWTELEGKNKTFWALSVPTRPFMRIILADDQNMKVINGPTLMASSGSLKIRHNKTLSATVSGSFWMKKLHGRW